MVYVTAENNNTAYTPPRYLDSLQVTCSVYYLRRVGSNMPHTAHAQTRGIQTACASGETN